MGTGCHVRQNVGEEGPANRFPELRERRQHIAVGDSPRMKSVHEYKPRERRQRRLALNESGSIKAKDSVAALAAVPDRIAFRWAVAHGYMLPPLSRRRVLTATPRVTSYESTSHPK